MRHPFGLLLAALAVCGAACGDGSAGRIPPGTTRDSGPEDGSLDARGPRGEDPLLPRADDELALPFGGPAVQYEFSVEADLARLDVVLAVDTTGSFAGEIDNLQAALSDKVIPRVKERIDDAAFAVVRFADFPVDPFGAPNDRAYELLTPMTTNAAAVAEAVARLDMPLQAGGDAPEAGAEALYQIATGEGLEADGVADGAAAIAPYAGAGAPGVGFRGGAYRVALLCTDAPSHEPSDYAGAIPGTHSTAEATLALVAARVRTLGIVSSIAPRSWLEDIAIRTGATGAPNADGRCETAVPPGTRAPVDGVCPFVFDVLGSGAGVSNTVVDAILESVNAVAFDRVEGRVADNRLGFVEAVRPLRAEVIDGPPPALIDEEAPLGVPEAFGEVRQRVKLFFAADLLNTSIRPMATDESFRLRFEVWGDGVLLASRSLRVVVPGE